MVRAATADDVEAVARIWHDGFHDGHRGHVPDALLAYRHPDSFPPRVTERLHAIWVAEVDGAPAGFVVVVDDELEQVYVGREHRGTGVAAELLDFAEQRVATRYESAWLAVAAGNARARRFYERMGWYDDGPSVYQAEIEGGTFDVPVRTYRKRLTAAS